MEFVIFVVWWWCVVVVAHVYVLWKVCKGGVGGGCNDIDVPALQRGSSNTKSTTMWRQDDLKKIPCFEYEAEERDEAVGGTPDPCAVCLEGFKVGDKCRLLPNCKHSFHAQCIDSWLVKTPICPICRTPAN
ncbi:hypothetical protein Acr_06g0005030 [Actinidia rufa]|uniref:RING-type domain-containing protein n=1 Tax=Actinidia rufa TaxID=165716 RepID=A0A7J0EQ62_9ERIC|nr:hypothetical protein Acr_06g0005030 [Actinidia rufa]